MNLDDLYRQHVNDLYRYLFSLSKDHYTAEDLVQEAFYRAYLQMEDYEFQNIKAWLFKVAYHAFIDYNRKHKRVTLSDKLSYSMEHSQTPEKDFLDREGFKMLLSCIHTLPENEKHAILLCDLHQLHYQEAADVLDLKLNTLKSHVFRGRKKLIEMIKERRIHDDR
ncbi:sigma-70 family RNA polymerase sigma factor [Peribacillus tepidiphilus]|uniref:sigma-70 family RNA polymerase sigma factor n=1 Tax=Peribacillus tepidiphilus TaxID=2652445 RepID=UPI0035B516EE